MSAARTLATLLLLLGGSLLCAQDGALDAALNAAARAAPQQVVLPAFDYTRIGWEPATAPGTDPELDRELALYNYNRHTGDWRISQLRCGLITHHRILKFDSGSAAFIAVVGLAPGIAPRVIPLQRNGHGDADPEQDPHNVAIANEILAEEAVLPKTYGDWMARAIFYLYLTGATPQVLDPNHRYGVTPPGPASTWVPLLVPEPQGMGIEFYDVRSLDDVVCWDFDFDAKGALFGVGRRDGTAQTFPRGRYR